jgi:tRNA A37 threonylcarbamoyladenosine biosynthesis protein TsaE
LNFNFQIRELARIYLSLQECKEYYIKYLMDKKFIIVSLEGNVGAGKSTLFEILR